MGDADINIYVLRCRILLHLEKWFEAASDLKVATNINPSHVTLYELKLQILQHAVTLKNEANSCISRDDLKCAESFLDQALKLDEDDWRAIFVRGTLLKRLNMLPECLQDLMTVFSFQGRDGEKQDEITRQLAEANNQLGLNYFKAGKLAEAKAKFDTAISYDPKDLLVLKNLAAYRYRIDDIEGEIQDHLVILSIDTEDVASAKRLSDIYLKIGKDWNSQGKFEEAIRSLTNSIKYCSDCDEAYYERARSYLDLTSLNSRLNHES